MLDCGCMEFVKAKEAAKTYSENCKRRKKAKQIKLFVLSFFFLFSIGTAYVFGASNASTRETEGKITVITEDGNLWEAEGVVEFDTKGTVSIYDDEIIAFKSEM